MCLQIHVMQAKCNFQAKASCICGVLVQSGDDVIKVTSCITDKGVKQEDVKAGILKVFVYKNGDLTPGFKYYEKGSKGGYVVCIQTQLLGRL